MNPLEMILGAAGGGVLNQIAGQFGLNPNQAQSAIGALLPALMGGVQRNTQQEGGLESLLGALTGGNHGQYLDDPDRLAQPETTQDGNSILGHLLGSKDASRALASQASQQTGLDSSLLKQMLPIVASLAMGALSKQSSQSNLAGAMQSQGASGVLGLLGAFLGGGQQQQPQQQHSVVEDVLGIAGKLFGGR